uniref:Uncharacterized protein n=1 Tax=Hippocampus comes TaxID=109280 RepID=A0A3Q3D354_HIPCM
MIVCPTLFSSKRRLKVALDLPPADTRSTKAPAGRMPPPIPPSSPAPRCLSLGVNGTCAEQLSVVFPPLSSTLALLVLVAVLAGVVLVSVATFHFHKRRLRNRKIQRAQEEYDCGCQLKYSHCRVGGGGGTPLHATVPHHSCIPKHSYPTSAFHTEMIGTQFILPTHPPTPAPKKTNTKMCLLTSF